MTAATVPVNGSRPATAAERQAAARDAYLASVAAGSSMSSAALARQFDMSERWGRNIVAEARQAAGTNGNGQSSRATPVQGRERKAASGDVPGRTREPGTAGREAPAALRDPVRASRGPAGRDPQRHSGARRHGGNAAAEPGGRPRRRPGSGGRRDDGRHRNAEAGGGGGSAVVAGLVHHADGRGRGGGSVVWAHVRGGPAGR
jgi:hypothetical protein